MSAAPIDSDSCERAVQIRAAFFLFRMGMRQRDEDRLASLVDQTAYLLEEIETLLPVISRVPDEVLEARLPPSERSVKEFYGAITELTRSRAVPAVESGLTTDEQWPAPHEVALAREWNRLDIEQIMNELRDGREQLLDAVSAYRHASDSLEAILARVVAFDLQCQRQIGERLFDVQPAPRITRMNGDQ